MDHNDKQHHGDLIDLFQFTQNVEKGEAVKAAKEFLGIQDSKPTQQTAKPKPQTGLMKPPPDTWKSMKRVHVWNYTHKDQMIGSVVRYEDDQGHKEVIPFFQPNGKPGIPKGLSMPLYGRTDSAYVFVTEGEKAVDALLQMGLAAVTSQGGSGAARKADWSVLKAVKTVFLLPDNDEAGRAYILDVVAALQAQNPECELKVVKLDGLPEKGDIVDWIQARLPDWDGYAEDERIGALKNELRQRVKDAKPIETEEPRFHDLILTFGSDVQPKAVNWLWPERFGTGFLSIVAGPGGVGKSTALISMAAIITRGGKWPFSDNKAEQGKVAWITGEESIEQQLTPRLMVAGADISEVFFVEGVILEDISEAEGGAPMRMSLDAHQIPGLKRKYPDLRLVVIDPLSAFLDARDSHKDSDVRQVFHPWVLAAEEARVAVVFIAHHNKAKGGHVRDRLSGSTAIRNSVRTVYAVLENPDDEGEYLFLPEKSNLSDGQIPGLVFRIIGKDWKRDEASGNVACVEWLRETDQKANVVAAAEASVAQPIEDAEQFLRTELNEGGRRVKDLKAASEDAGLSWRTVRRAQKKLAIKPHKDGFDSGWKWALPSSAYKPSENAKVATFSTKVASHHGWTPSEGLEDSNSPETAPLSHSHEGGHMPDSTKVANGGGHLREGAQGGHSNGGQLGGQLRPNDNPDKDETELL